jgi:SAM-dependent methyltransferase
MLDVITKSEYFALIDIGTASADTYTLKAMQDAWILDQARELDGARILEVGGGYSRVLPTLSGRNSCFNLDRFEGVAGGPSTVPEQPGIRVILGYIGDFEPALEPSSFDFVFSISVVEHIPHDRLADAFSDMYRCLKPGGRCCHAIDHFVGDAELAYSDRSLRAYMDAVERSGLHFAEHPKVMPGLRFSSCYASAPDLHLATEWRSSSELERLILENQVVSLKLICVK